MKTRWKVLVALVIAGGLIVFFTSGSVSSEQKALEETRRSLRAQGFKTTLSEFNFTTSEADRARAAALTFFGPYQRRPPLPEGYPDLMPSAGSNAVQVVWQREKWLSRSGEDYWPALAAALQEQRADLDHACAAALAGPIRFELKAGAGYAMLLPHLASLRQLLQTLSSRTLLELHNHNQAAAWTNLIALSRLTTAYDPEPAQVSHILRFALATLAYNSTWQALQAEAWNDEQLVQLQKEWEAPDFFKGLPETATFDLASAGPMFEAERTDPLTLGLTWQEVFRSPSTAWQQMTYRWRQMDYRRHGSYENEKDLLLYHRDRLLQLQRAVQASTWLEMRPLPGVTNLVPFQAKSQSRVQSMLNMRQLNLSFQMAGGGFLGRAAETEIRRRLIITAIALQRFHNQHHAYPQDLVELVPGLLKNPPVDFMDGQPLRYRRTDDGHFTLYSVGLDCVDDGGSGILPARAPDFADYPMAAVDVPPGRRIGRSKDLVWPRPASLADVQSFEQAQIAALTQRADQNEELSASEQWQRSDRRQKLAESLLAAKRKARVHEPSYRGRLLTELLRNEIVTGTNRMKLDEMLSLKPIVTGAEPEVITFEVPIAYDALTNLGSLGLYIDPDPKEDSDEGCGVVELDCQRATNGNCLLIWNTIYEAPGKHALQMGIELNEPTQNDDDLCGPLAPFVVSNLCQFSLSSATFNPAYGATLHAKLPEANGTYAIQLTAPEGALLRTITGSTTNGIIKVHWDLNDDRGQRCTNESFGSIFKVTLPDSGRSQTQKGP